MAENSNIEWCKHTFNMWRGCTKVSPACDICYAEAMSVRNPGTLGVWGKYGTRVIAAESYWQQPLAWDKKAELAGERHRVFCASLADVFEGPESMPPDAVEPVKNARLRLLSLIFKTPNLDWLLLTKRPENIKPILLDTVAGNWADPADVTDRVHAWIDGTRVPLNVWLGTTVENQKYADLRIPELLKIPATVRFLSCEPLLGPIDLSRYLFASGDEGEPAPRNEPMLPCLHLVIAGGESGGAKARPMHPNWPKSLRDQCTAAGVPFFFKQWGEWTGEFDDVCTPGGDLGGDVRRGIARILHAPGNPEGYFRSGDAWVKRIGKKKAGRLLDGRTWDEMPEAANVATAKS